MDFVETPLTTDELNTINNPGQDMKNSYLATNHLNPDQAAKDITAANYVGVPYTAILSNPDNAQQVHDAAKNKTITETNWNGIAQQYPKTSNFLSDPKNMAVSHDDIQNIAQHENNFNWFTNAINGINQFFNGSGSGMSYHQGLFKDVESMFADPALTMQNLGYNIRGIMSGIGKGFGDTTGITGLTTNLTNAFETGVNQERQQAGEKVLPLIPTYNSDMLTGAFQKMQGGVPLNDQEKQNMQNYYSRQQFDYNQLKSQGGSMSLATNKWIQGTGSGLADWFNIALSGELIASPIMGKLADTIPYIKTIMESGKTGEQILGKMIHGALTALPFSFSRSLLSQGKLPSANDVARDVLFFAASPIGGQFADALLKNVSPLIRQPLSGAMEGLTGFGAAGAETMAFGSPQEKKEYPSSFGSTILAQALFKAFSPETAMELMKTQNSIEFNNAMSEAATDSKLLKRAPDSYEDALSQLKQSTPVDNVYIPKQAFDNYFQSKNIDPSAVAHELGIGDQYTEKSATGEDMAIPYETFIRRLNNTPSGNHVTGLSNDIKFDPEGMTAREILEKAQGESEVHQDLIDELQNNIQKSEKVLSPEENKNKQGILNEFQNQVGNTGEKGETSETSLKEEAQPERRGIDELAQEHGFQDAGEAHLAFLAADKGFKDFALETGEEPEKAYSDYQRLKDKVAAMPESIRNNFRLDLQFFASGNGKDMTFEDYQNKEKMQALNDKYQQRIQGLKDNSQLEKQAAIKKAKTVERWKGLLDTKEAKEEGQDRLKTAKFKAQEKLSEAVQTGRDRLVKLKDKIFDQKTDAKEDQSYEKTWDKLLKQKDKTIGQVRNMWSKVEDLRPEYQEPLAKELEPYTTFNPESRKGKGLQQIADFVNSNPDKAQGMPQKIQNQLQELDKKSIYDLGLEELQHVHDTMEKYIDFNTLKNQLIKKQINRAYDVIGKDAAQRVVKATDDVNKIESDTSSTKVKTDKQKSFWHFVERNIIHTDLISQRLDGEKNGPIKDTFFNKANDAENRYQGKYYEFIDNFKKIIQDSGADIRDWTESVNQKDKGVNRVPVSFESQKEPFEMSKANRMSLYLSSLDPEIRRNILSDRGGINFDNQNKVIKVTQADLDKMYSEMSQGEKYIADRTSKELYNSTMKDAINEVSLKYDGKAIATKENYYREKVPDNLLDLSPEELRNNPYARFNAEEQGFLKERTNGRHAVEIGDFFKDFINHADGVASYYGKTDYVHDATALLNHPDFKSAMDNFDGGKTYDYLQQYVKDQQGSRYGVFDDVNSLYAKFMRNSIRSTLGINPASWIKHWSSWIMEMKDISPKYLADAINSKASFNDTTNEIKQNAPVLRRVLEGSFSPETGELGEVGKYKQILLDEKPLLDKTMGGFDVANKLKLVHLWNAIKAETVQEHPGLQGDAFWKQVSDRTEDIFSKSNTLFRTSDRPGWFRSDNNFAKTMSLFQSFGNTCVNELYRAGLDYSQSGKTFSDKADLIKRMGLTTLCMSVLPAAIGTGWKALLGQKQNKAPLALQSVNNMVESIPVVGQLTAGTLEGAFNGMQYQDLSTLPLDVLNAVGHSGYYAAQLASHSASGETYTAGKYAGETKVPHDFIKLLPELTQAGGYLFGIPIINTIKLGAWFTHKK